MAAKLRAAPGPAVVALLLATAWLVVLAATVADARPLKNEPPSSSEGDNARVPAVVVESPAGGIQTVVGAAEHGSSSECGNKFMMSIDMLGGIKDSGPSPGAGH